MRTSGRKIRLVLPGESRGISLFVRLKDSAITASICQAHFWIQKVNPGASQTYLDWPAHLGEERAAELLEQIFFEPLAYP
jgi:hypothetical protein